jgi:hypothetical protein
MLKEFPLFCDNQLISCSGHQHFSLRNRAEEGCFCPGRDRPETGL